MGKGLILYQSKYGATKKYVDWIVEATNFDCLETKKADKKKVSEYEVIILAGGVYASGIAGLSFLKKNIELLHSKKVAVFCVGASPYEDKAVQQNYEHNFKGSLNGIPCYYGRGTWDLDKMSFTDRTLCKMLQKSVAKQDPDTYEPWQKALLCAGDQTCDWTEKEYLQPLFDWIKTQMSI